jgi:hypothetical protein
VIVALHKAPPHEVFLIQFPSLLMLVQVAKAVSKDAGRCERVRMIIPEHSSPSGKRVVVQLPRLFVLAKFVQSGSEIAG